MTLCNLRSTKAQGGFTAKMGRLCSHTHKQVSIDKASMFDVNHTQPLCARTQNHHKPMSIDKTGMLEATHMTAPTAHISLFSEGRDT